MKNLAIVVVLLILIGGGFYISNNKTDQDDAMMMEKDGDAMMNEDQNMMHEDSAMMEGEVDNAMMKEDGDKMMEKDDDAMMMENGDAMMMKNETGHYEDYSPEKLSRANEGDVVLFFKANWCPTCNSFDKNVLSNLTSIPKNVSLLKVDYDNSSELKQKYGVTYQHTFVQVDAQGNLISKWSGSPTLSALLTQVK
jgi:thiol-disulfide isomerase/thioredoxin